MAVIMMRASVGCMVNRIPEGFSRKSLTTTADAEGSLSRVGYTGTRTKAARPTGRSAARAGDGSFVNPCVETCAIAVARNKEVAGIDGRVIAVCSFSRRATPRATPTGTPRAVSKVRLERASRCWCNGRVARAAALVAALAVVLVLAPPVHAAAPNYILVSGPGLKRPILLGNWSENAALLSALVNAPRAKGSVVLALARRPRFDLAEFWGWGSRPRPTRPSQANQHGWFYPAHSSKPAVIVLMVNGYRFPRFVPGAVVRILARHHVPLRL